MIRQLLKSKTITIGTLVLILLLALSFVYTFVLKSHLTVRTHVLFDQHKNFIGRSPFPPSWRFPLGTNDAGDNMLYVLIDGAKYTILFALCVAILRVGIGAIFGITRALYGLKIKSTPSNLFQALQTVPVALLVYFILQPVINDTDRVVNFQKSIEYAGSQDGMPPNFSLVTTIIFEVVILTLIALPTVSRLIGNETQLIMRNEFILSAKTLGSNRWHLLKKHIFPHLFPKLLIIFMQQLVQALLIIMHLGILLLFFGGTKVVIYSHGGLGNETSIDPLTFEWSGIIGSTFANISATPWIPLSPIIMCTLVILILNIMLEKMKDVFTNYQPVKKGQTIEKPVSGAIRVDDPHAFDLEPHRLKEGSG